MNRNCHGYVGADLLMLTREAGMRAIKRSTSDPVAALDDMRGVGKWTVLFEDFEYALQHVRPSSLREVYVDVPTVRWTDIGGQQEVKKRLQEMVSISDAYFSHLRCLRCLF